MISLKKLVPVFAVLLLFTGTSLAQLKNLTLNDIFMSDKFKLKTLSVDWLPGEDAYTFTKFDSATNAEQIWIHDIKTGEEKTLLSYAELNSQVSDFSSHVSAYFYSPDKKYILFTGALRARRLKTGGNFYLYDTGTKRLQLVSGVSDPEEQKIIEFSPDGTKISYVKDNNLYVYDIATASTKQLTTDGNENIINGNFDWVYEEEFEIINGYEWSPDSKYIAYWRLDQSKVPIYRITDFMPTYLKIEEQHYPYAGYPNSSVKIGLTDVTNGKTSWVNTGNDSDFYIPRIEWTSDPKSLAVEKLNRLQNHFDILVADRETGDANSILIEDDKDYLEVNNDLTFLKDGKGFIWESERSGNNHLYLFDMQGRQKVELTKGKYDVAALAYVDEVHGKVYYTSSETSPMQRELYVVDLDGKNKKELTKEAGVHNIDFSPLGDYYIDSYSTFTMPPSWRLYLSDGKYVSTLAENEKDQLESYSKGESSFIQAETTDNEKLNAWMIKPANFDTSKKYPVLFYVYGGPGSQTVMDSYGYTNYLWYQYLAEQGYIIFSVDNRGTGARGKDFRQITYKNLGYYESMDQAEAAKYLAKTYAYVDASRIGIWGWSYGGYMTSLTVFKYGDVFKLGVAVAPVTSWKLYDTIYTERYMQTPDLNPKGYEESAPQVYADQLKRKFLVIQGTADDNVHWQNSIQLVDKLENANKQFSLMYYPGKDHGIGGKITRDNLFTHITEYILQNL